MAERPRLYLIDTYGLLFRAYHARARSQAPAMRTSKGMPTEAIYIFNNMLRRLLASKPPEYLAAVVESKGKTFREQSFAQYKANRAAMPPDLAEQIPYLYKLLEAQKIPVLQYEGFEADDVIGAIAKGAASQGVDVVIVSSDKDLLQLVNHRVRMLNPMKDDTVYDVAAAREFMGVAPEQIPDLLALKGDAIDNIPGAPGIGEKGARELIQRFGSVEAALENAAAISKRTQRESLLEHRDQILLSKKLATIDTTVPIDWRLEDLARREPDREQLRQLYRELEFFSLLKDLGPSQAPSGGDWAMLADAASVQAYVDQIERDKPLAVLIAAAPTGALALEAVIGLAQQPRLGRAVSVHLLEPLRGILEDPQLLKVTHNLKALLLELWTHGVQAEGFGRDVMLEAFLLQADAAAPDLEKLCERVLDWRPGASLEQRAAAIVELAGYFQPLMAAKPELDRLYRETEIPLARVLAKMERTGIRVEREQLARLSAQMEAEIARLTAEIHQLAGHPFNVNSPQQLGKVLFEELGLPAPVKYGKGKQISTAAEVLEDLQHEHPIASKVLEYRQLAKLKGTYVDALPQRIDPATGRLHTCFHQTGAATGRLSSSDPNLQNIPIRTELGREIRAAFVPEPGWKLVVADYSQIELRLLAHLSGDRLLVEAFRAGQDIHTRTACEVFGVRPEEVTAEMRRRAKAVNFGIVYGQTPFGLAAQLGIAREEAERYILNYFERYRGVREFIDRTIEEVRRCGVAKTMFGRERPIPDMQSRNPNARAFAERTAVNTPLQGAAADLIKMAMVRIDNQLEKQGLKTRLLLQVHDELVLESPSEEAHQAAQLVREQMEGVIALRVPLVVETGIGDNWRDAK